MRICFNMKSCRSEPFLFTAFVCCVQSLTQMEREKIVWEFEQLYHSLKEHEYRLLARLEELDLAIYNSINGAITQFSCNISHLSALIAQLEEKQQQPTRELLQVTRRALQGSLLDAAGQGSFTVVRSSRFPLSFWTA